MGRKQGAKEADLARQFGENLTLLRSRVGLTQMGTAERSGLNRSEIRLLEKGWRVPRLDTLLKVAGAVEVEACELLRGMTWELDPPKGGSS